MVVGIVMDQCGRPLCSELWPGNTADVTTLLPVVDRLRARFGVGRICIVADRGMISAPTIAALERRQLEYILGVRERNSPEVYEQVLADPAPFVPIAVPRDCGTLTELEAKAAKLGERRYIVCRNLAEARRDTEQRRHPGGAAQQAHTGRQSARRQQRLPPLSEDPRRRTLRHRRSARRPGCPLRWALRIAHQHRADRLAGDAALP